MSLHHDIIVVSGLPRSGTSLMMQMLDRGGIPVLTDNIRGADTDNPRGYYEFEAVKKTKENGAWIATARGKAVKMVSSLLYDLPTTERYRVVFQRRDFDEMLESQEKMLQRLNRPAAPRAQMKRSFQSHLDRLFQWMRQQRHLQVLKVNYNEIIESPDAEIQRVVEFLDGIPHAAKMLDAIAPKLYRNRISR